MPTEYIPIAILFVLATAIALIIVGLSSILGPRKPNKRKNMPYESGMTPVGDAVHRRSPVRFYLIAVLFILFDIEIIFFLPWAIVFQQLGAPDAPGVFGLIEMIIFVAILVVGYIYVLKKGALEWG